MAIAAAIAAAGAIGSAGIGAYSASKASDQQVAMQQQALAAQNKNFDSALDFQKSTFDTSKNALNPFITSGTNLLPTLQNLLTPGASQTDTLSKLPGFQFQSQYGTQAATNALAARGLAGSTGPVARAVSDYNNGLAGTSFNNYVQQLLQGAGLGASGANALAGAAGTAGSNVGGLTANTNNTIGNTLTGIGNAQAAGTLGVSNALSGGLTGAANSGTNALLLSKLFPGASTTANAGGGIYGNPTGYSTNPWSSQGVFGGVSNG